MPAQTLLHLAFLLLGLYLIRVGVQLEDADESLAWTLIKKATLLLGITLVATNGLMILLIIAGGIS